MNGDDLPALARSWSERMDCLAPCMMRDDLGPVLVLGSSLICWVAEEEADSFFIDLCFLCLPDSCLTLTAVRSDKEAGVRKDSSWSTSSSPTWPSWFWKPEEGRIGVEEGDSAKPLEKMGSLSILRLDDADLLLSDLMEDLLKMGSNSMSSSISLTDSEELGWLESSESENTPPSMMERRRRWEEAEEADEVEEEEEAERTERVSSSSEVKGSLSEPPWAISAESISSSEELRPREVAGEYSTAWGGLEYLALALSLILSNSVSEMTSDSASVSSLISCLGRGWRDWLELGRGEPTGGGRRGEEEGVMPFFALEIARSMAAIVSACDLASCPATA